MRLALGMIVFPNTGSELQQDMRRVMGAVPSKENGPDLLHCKTGK